MCDFLMSHSDLLSCDGSTFDTLPSTHTMASCHRLARVALGGLGGCSALPRPCHAAMARVCISRAKSARPAEVEDVSSSSQGVDHVSHTGVKLTKVAGGSARVRDAVFSGAVTSFTNTV